MSRVAVLQVLISLSVMVSAGPYVGLIPKYFHPGWPMNIAVTIHDTTNSGMTTVRAELHGTEEGSSVKLGDAEGLFNPGDSKLLSMQIPPEIDPSLTSFYVELTASGGQKFTYKKTISLNVNETVLLVQTDKNIYKPGQSVRFRVLNLNKDLAPINSPVNAFILDAKGIKLERYDNLYSSNGVVDRVFKLPFYASLGMWAVQLQDREKNVLHTNHFKVDEYVLPKFSVDVDPQPGFLIWGIYNQSPAIVVTTKYTYGKAVQGTCLLTLGLRGGNVFAKISKKIPESGIVEFVDIDWNNVIGDQPSDKKVLVAVVNVTDVMGRTEMGDATIDVFRGDHMIEILPGSAKVLYSGVKAEFYIKISDHYGNPATEQQAEVTITMPNMDSVMIRVEMEEGKAYTTCEFTPFWDRTRYPEYENEIKGAIDVKMVSDRLTRVQQVLRWYVSKNGDSVKIESLFNMKIVKGLEQEFEIKTTTDNPSTILAYTVVSQGIILETGTIKNKKLTLTPTFEMCPHARLVVYQLSQSRKDEDAELVADTITISPEKCLDREVTVTFDAREQRTGTDANMQIDVKDGDSTVSKIFDVFYLAVDKSITLLQGHTMMTKQRALKALDDLNNLKLDVDPVDATTVFDNLDVEVVTYVSIAEPLDDPIIMEMEIAMAGAADHARRESAASGSKPKAPEAKEEKGSVEVSTTKVRKNFPETWLWGHGKTTNGQFRTQVRLPDTITSWTVSAFAVNEDGIAPAGAPFQLNAFNPFFLSLNLPYSIKRGEVFTLRITVFNYRPQQVDATVRLELGDDFLITGGLMKDGWMEHAVRMPANLASSVIYEINATTVGKIKFRVAAENKDDSAQRDEVIRELIVKPPGEERDYSETEVLLLMDDSSVTKTFQVEWPDEDIVTGSQRLQLKVTGQILGQSLSNLRSLVRMPTGCGEQNMIGLVPNIYGASYIKETQQTEAINFLDEMTENMKAGYQRELNYKHDDGSFSAFGTSDNAGSTWLTAFVMRSFAAATKFISIDENVMTKAVEFVLKKQNSKGYFVENGRVIHSEMQSGTNSEGIALTVYCLLSILEAQDYVSVSSMDTVIDKAVRKVLADLPKIRSSTTGSLFLPAMTAYTLSLVRDPSSAVEQAINELVATLEDSNVPWRSTSEDILKPTTTFRGTSPSLLMTGAYTLMTYMKRGSMDDAITVMKWLQTRQNQNGGFGSTQDTVLVLQSLAEFGIFYRNIEATGEVEVTVPGQEKETLDISGGRSILLQVVDLPVGASEVVVKLSGKTDTVAVVKIVYNYYTPVKESDNKSGPKSNMEVYTRSQYITEIHHHVEACVKSNLDPSVGMYIASIDLPSGETPSETIETMQRNNKLVSRVETEDNKKINFYLNEIPKSGYCVKAMVERQMDFAVQMPGSAKFYAYYEPEYYTESELNLSGGDNCSGDQCGSAATITFTSVLLTSFICIITSLLACM